MAIRAILEEEGEDLIIGGADVAVIGTTAGGEIIQIVGGTVTLNPSFAAGGDTIILPGEASDYTVASQGSVVIFTSGEATVRIPASDFASTVGFSDGDDLRALRFDLSASPPVLLLGEQAVGTGESPVTPFDPDSVATFTTGIDVVRGNAASNLFEIDASLLQPGDQLIDLWDLDRDLLRVRIEDSAVASVDFGSPRIENVERIEILNTAGTLVGFDLADTSGLLSFVIELGGGSIDLRGVPVTGDGDAPFDVILRGGSADSTASIILVGEENFDPSTYLAGLVLEGVRLAELGATLASGPEFISVAKIEVRGDNRVDTLNVAARQIELFGNGNLRVTEPLDAQVFSVTSTIEGDLELRFGDGGQSLQISNLDDRDIVAGGTGSDILNVYGRVDLSQANRVSGFEQITFLSDGETVRVIFNARNGPSEDYRDTSPVFVSARFSSLPDAPVAFSFIADTDDVERDFLYQINGTYGVNYIKLDEGGQGDVVFTGGANDFVLIGAPDRGRGDRAMTRGGDDTIILNGFGDSYIDGGAGNDRFDLLLFDLASDFQILGGEGDDTLVLVAAWQRTFDGGAGSDTLIIENGNTVDDSDFINMRSVENLIFSNDFRPEISGTGPVRLGELAAQAGVRTVSFGDRAFDREYSLDATRFPSSLVINGGVNSDDLIGGLADDIIAGGAGGDLLVGWVGADTLTGGAGADLFLYGYAEESSTESFDTIRDFSAAQGDRLAFDFITDNDADGTVDNIVWMGNFNSMTSASEALKGGDGTVQILYVQGSGGGFVYVDLDDDGAITNADIAIYLEGVDRIDVDSLVVFEEGRTPPPSARISVEESDLDMGIAPNPPFEEVDFSFA